MTQALAIAAWLIKNAGTVALATKLILQAQKAYTENSDKKAWVMSTLRASKEILPDTADRLIDALVDFAHLLGWIKET